jgi:hypothetical protein
MHEEPSDGFGDTLDDEWPDEPDRWRIHEQGSIDEIPPLEAKIVKHRARFVDEYEAGCEEPLHPSRCWPCKDCEEAASDFFTIPVYRRAIRIKIGLPVDVFVSDKEIARFVVHAEKFGPEMVVETAIEEGWHPDRLRLLQVEVESVAARGERWSRNGHKPTSPKELTKAVATLAADGLPVAEIARDLDIDVDRADRILSAHRKTVRRRRPKAGEQAARVAALWAEQPNTTMIAGKLGISPKRVQQLLVDQGLLGGQTRADPSGITPSFAGVSRPPIHEQEVQDV